MLEALIENLPWVVGLLSLFSFLAVASWGTERRKEREALYRSEAIKKIAEMQGDTPEAVVKLLRDAIATWKEPPGPMHSPQAHAHYRIQTLQNIAESPGAGGEAVLAFLREEQKIQARRTRDGLRIAGVICVVVGIALAIVMWVMLPEKPAYLVGLIPSTVGVVLFGSSSFVGSESSL